MINLPSIRNIIKENALFNREINSIDDIENKYWKNIIPNFIYKFDKINNVGGLNYNFNTNNNNLTIDLSYSNLALYIYELVDLFTDKKLDKLNINLLEFRIYYVNFIFKKFNIPIKNLNIEFNNLSGNEFNIQFDEFTNFKDNKFIFNDKKSSTGIFNLHFDKSDGRLFKNKEEFINKFLKNVFGYPNNLYIKRGDKLKIIIENFESNSELYKSLKKDLIDNGNTDYRKVIKDISGGKYEWKLNNINNLESFFFEFGTHSINFTLLRK